MSIIVLPIVGIIFVVVLVSKGSSKAIATSAVVAFLSGGLLNSLVLGLLFLALLVCTVFSLVPRWKNWRYKFAAMTLTVFLLAVTGILVTRTFRQNQLRDEYPVISLRDRLKSNQKPAVANFPEQANRYNNRFHHWNDRRDVAIGFLHTSAVEQFLNAPEFGVMRMSFDPLRTLANDDGTPVRLFPYAEFADNSGFKDREIDRSRSDPLEGRLEGSHFELQSWFADEDRNGVVEDVDHVAGFLPHAITENIKNSREARWLNLPGADEKPFEYQTLTLKSLQLLGLLYHDGPVVYDLDTTPTMVNAETAPIRQLDEFEIRALEMLKEGNPVYYEVHGNTARMLGALINADSCTKCHDGPSNQLLGAFSYILTSDGGDKPPNSIVQK